MFYLFSKIFIFPIIRLIWVKDVQGIKNIPNKNGAIVASNHESYFDFICFSAVCPRRIYYLAGEVFFKKWWWRFLMVLTGQIRIDRDKKDKSFALRKILSVLKNKKIIGIFPEGTRSSDGKLQRAYLGVAKIALMAKVPVIPVGIMGTFEIMSRHDKIPNFKKCTIKIGAPINLEDYYGKDIDKKMLNIITHGMVMKNIAKLTEESYNFN